MKAAQGVYTSNHYIALEFIENVDWASNSELTE